MKAVAISIVVLALVAGIVPLFTDCQSQGRAITLASGAQVPMKCHWTGVAEAALAVPLAGLGVVLAFSRKKETQRSLSLVGLPMGALVVLLPAQLIGVCASDEMLCNMIMRPTLIMAGLLTMALSGAAIILARGEEPLTEVAVAA